MSDELLNRARELLALREKATPIEGAVFNRYGHGGGRLYNERAGKRTLIADCFNESDREFFFAAYDMADAIAALRAEVERLETSYNIRNDEVRFLIGVNSELRARAEAAEALQAARAAIPATVATCDTEANALVELRAENERLQSDCTRIAVENMGHRIRAEVAEARLRELASAEAVAWAKFDGTEITHMEMSDGSGADFDLVGSGFVPLIRRPEVKS